MLVEKVFGHKLKYNRKRYFELMKILFLWGNFEIYYSATLGITLNKVKWQETACLVLSKGPRKILAKNQSST